MGLNPTPSAGLGAPTRRLRNVSISTEHVGLSIPPGDELVVTEDVAAQLLAASRAFTESDSDRARRAVAGLESHAGPETEPEPEPAKVAKKAAKKAAKA